MPMDEKKIQQLIQRGRGFLRRPSPPDEWVPEDYETDQQLRRPQPPLFKAPMSDERILLPRDFDKLPLAGALATFAGRKSSRVYTDAAISLRAFSFLLWATQGVRDIRGKSYATLRTVPCGGARHEFECYITVYRVEGLAPGRYHYMPDLHAVEKLAGAADPALDTQALCDQAWAGRAAAVFYYSCIPYRSEWRYGVWAHPPVLMDAGHITENLYLACSALGDLGTCAIAAVDSAAANDMFGLDGEEEFILYAAPVGGIAAENAAAEDLFYAFVREEGL